MRIKSMSNHNCTKPDNSEDALERDVDVLHDSCLVADAHSDLTMDICHHRVGPIPDGVP